MSIDLLRDVPNWSGLSPQDQEEVWRLLSLGANIRAIRYYRQASGLGLARAHEAVALLMAYRRPNPVVRETQPCPYCGRPLRTALAQQCFECGADWHSGQGNMV